MKMRGDGLESKVKLIAKRDIDLDEYGRRYIPFCDFNKHRGIVKREHVCIQRKCSHYYRLYIQREE